VAVAGVTRRGAGFLAAPLIAPTALGECAGLKLARGSAFRAISPFEPLRSGPASGLADGLDSIGGDESECVEGAFTNDSESRVLSSDFFSEGAASSSLLARGELSEFMKGRLVTAEDGAVGLARVAASALRDCADGFSERDSSVSGAGGFTAGVLAVFVACGAGVPEVVSPGRLGSAGDVASTARIDFWGSGKCFPSEPRPMVSPRVRLMTANKSTSAAT
jgi:hypothetical protein